MHPAIQKIASSTDYSTRDLLECEEIFPSCDPEEKSWYIQKRMKTVMSSSVSLFSRRMRTSGYQDGRPRDYVWGPMFSRMSEFFDRLRYGEAKAIVYLSYCEKDNNRPLFLKHIPWDPPYPHYIFGIQQDHLTDSGIPDILSGIKGEKVGLMIVPSMMELMTIGGFDPCVLDPNRYIIHTTGEPLLGEEIPFEKAGLSIRDNMRCWDGGATFFTCEYSNRHWVDFVSNNWLDGNELVSSDLFNSAQLFIDYRNGDCISWERKSTCACGRPIDNICFNKREQRIFVDNHLFQYRTLQLAFDTACKEAGADVVNLQIGVDEKKKIVTFYGQTTSELPEEFVSMLTEYVCVSYPWLTRWLVRYSQRIGRISLYKKFPVFRESVFDDFKAL